MSDSSNADDDGQIVDPEIAELLKFEPAPRKLNKVNGWTPAMQRRFIAKLAELGSPAKAAAALNKDRYGIEKVYKAEGAESFRAAWDKAIAIAQERAAERQEKMQREWTGVRPPGGTDRRASGPAPASSPRGGPLPGQVINEFGEYEDEESLHRRADEARDNVAGKLLKLRRLYLQEISSSPGKRAAFEILSDFDVDWDKAERCEPQGDEPYATPNMRDPQFLLTAEAGWMGHMARGPDKVAELRAAIDEHREAEGLPPVDWSDE